ncbi:UNVERIFIED_CONTAM: hypothetical protein K2H54_023829 [Gekko kuhli]
MCPELGLSGCHQPRDIGSSVTLITADSPGRPAPFSGSSWALHCCGSGRHWGCLLAVGAPLSLCVLSGLAAVHEFPGFLLYYRISHLIMKAYKDSSSSSSSFPRSRVKVFHITYYLFYFSYKISEISQARTSEDSDGAQTVGALSGNHQTTVDTFDTDDSHSGQHESTMEQEETEQKEEANSVISKNTVTSQTGQ